MVYTVLSRTQQSTDESKWKMSTYHILHHNTFVVDVVSLRKMLLLYPTWRRNTAQGKRAIKSLSTFFISCSHVQAFLMRTCCTEPWSMVVVSPSGRLYVVYGRKKSQELWRNIFETEVGLSIKDLTSWCLNVISKKGEVFRAQDTNM